MQEPLLASITRLLRYQRSPESATARFRAWMHNADILPKLQQQLEIFLAAHGKFREVVYDTQGILDDGSDVVIRVPPSNGETLPKLICFQAKSFGDLSKDTYMQELKAQRDDTLRKVHGLEYYFLLLCTDMKVHKAKVRNILAEFRSAMLTEVIEPAYAYTFLHHSVTRIDAFVKRSVEAEDLVFSRAIQDLNTFDSPSARALAIYVAVQSIMTGITEFNLSHIISSQPLRTVYSELRERQALLLEESASKHRRKRRSDDCDEDEPIQISEFQEQLANDLENMDTDAVVPVTGTEVVRFLPDQMRALTAVIADALARYEYNEHQVFEYMIDVMGVRD